MTSNLEIITMDESRNFKFLPLRDQERVVPELSILSRIILIMDYQILITISGTGCSGKIDVHF